MRQLDVGDPVSKRRIGDNAAPLVAIERTYATVVAPDSSFSTRLTPGHQSGQRSIA